MCWTVQRNLRGGDDRTPAIRICDKHLPLNCSARLPRTLREGTSTYQPEDERHDCYFLHHCDSPFASSTPLQFLANMHRRTIHGEGKPLAKGHTGLSD